MSALEISSAVLLSVGCFFALTGGLGMLRMPDFYTRLHPAGKSDSFAQVLILGGLMCQTDDVMVAIKLVLICFVLFVTSPTATHAITKAAHLDGLKPIEHEGGDR
ncbi:MAG: monovalent cation/H(+) antiporter subunit G [Nannocystaceae bacterium]